MIVFIWNKLSSKNTSSIDSILFYFSMHQHSHQLSHRLLGTLGEDIGNFETRHINGHVFSCEKYCGFVSPPIPPPLHPPLPPLLSPPLPPPLPPYLPPFLPFSLLSSFFSSSKIKILRISVSSRESQIDSEYAISWYKYFKDNFCFKKNFQRWPPTEADKGQRSSGL